MKVEANCAYCGSLFSAPHWKGQRYCSKLCGNHSSKNKRHGHATARTREHATWLDMRNRCRNPKAHNYARYGGRGITVCERWDSFENFLADMGPKPGKGYSIERKDNNGNYEPSNCKWATQMEQNRNRCPPSEWRNAVSAVTSTDRAEPGWSAAQFWEYVEGLTDAHVMGQIRDMLSSQGLSVTSQQRAQGE